jgi:hypothetical protein
MVVAEAAGDATCGKDAAGALAGAEVEAATWAGAEPAASAGITASFSAARNSEAISDKDEAGTPQLDSATAGNKSKAKSTKSRLFMCYSF